MTQATITEAAPRFAPVSPAYGRYALTLLVLIYTVNFLDRQILSSIGEPIKNELHLTDSQMGALGGIFFAFVYTVLGIPIARVADKANRPWIMTISLALWSGFTVLSAFARNFGVLALARAGVGIGEAGCSPTAHSLLADYFPREKRATALAIYSMGISIGTLLGFAVGGIVAQRYGWRASFLVSGLPGLFFAVLAILTLREPRSQLSRDAQASANASSHISLLMVFSTLEKRPTFWLFSLAGAFYSFVSYAHSQFLTPFFLRNHTPAITALAAQFHMAPKPGEAPLGFLSLALGLTAGFGGAFGSWFGGVAADKWGARNIRDYTLFPLIIPILTTPVLWYVASTDNVSLALVLMLLPNITVGAWWGPVYGGVQGLVPPAMRALSAAVCLFVINMIGLGGGPSTFGIVTSQMTTHYLAGTGLDAAVLHPRNRGGQGRLRRSGRPRHQDHRLSVDPDPPHRHAVPAGQPLDHQGRCRACRDPAGQGHHHRPVRLLHLHRHRPARLLPGQRLSEVLQDRAPFRRLGRRHAGRNHHRRPGRRGCRPDDRGGRPAKSGLSAPHHQ